MSRVTEVQTAVSAYLSAYEKANAGKPGSNTMSSATMIGSLIAWVGMQTPVDEVLVRLEAMTKKLLQDS